jgi:hypothetical protein
LIKIGFKSRSPDQLCWLKLKITSIIKVMTILPDYTASHPIRQ